jgi:AcrR family transcriptional regulator
VSKPASAERPARTKLVDQASDLFYAEGIHAISADRIIAGVGTTKATFYRHFPTKDDLVLAYLRGQAEVERNGMTAAASAADPHRALRAVVAVLADSSCRPGFRGCPFINAAAEYPDAAHPVRALIDEHRGWWHVFFRELAERLGVPSGAPADTVADQILMLRDGAMIAGYVGDPTRVKKLLGPAIASIVAAAQPAAQPGAQPAAQPAGTG